MGVGPGGVMITQSTNKERINLGFIGTIGIARGEKRGRRGGGETEERGEM